MDEEDIWHAIVIIILSLVCIVLLGWCSIATGIIHVGAQQAQKAFNSTYDFDAMNSNYEWFHTTYNDILATKDKIHDAYELSIQKNIPDDTRSMYQVNYSGLTNFIRSMVSEYNAKSSMWTRKIAKDKELPYKIRVEIDGGDCKISEINE